MPKFLNRVVPTGQDGVRVASQLFGARADCDLDTGAKVGGGTPTDNAAVLNAVPDAATEAIPLALEVDGGFALDGALVLPEGGNASVVGRGWGTGLYTMSGSNDCGIRMANSPVPPFSNFDPHVDDEEAPAMAAGGVVLRDFRLNCNRGTYPTGNVSTTGEGWDARGRFDALPDLPGFGYTGIDLVALPSVLIDHVWVYDPPTYHVRLNACDEVVIRGCRFEAPDRGINTDGVHLNGCRDIRISDCYFKTGDDPIALNNDEGYAVAGLHCVATNLVLDGCNDVIRLHGESVGTGRVVVSNVVGEVAYCGVVIGIPGGDGSAMANTDVLVGPATLRVSTPSFGFVYAMGSIRHAQLADVTILSPGGDLYFFQAEDATIQAATARVRVVRTSEGSGKSSLVRSSSGTIGDLFVQSFAVEDPAGSSYADADYLVELTGTATVGRVTIESLDPRHVAAFCNDWSKIGSVAGPGLMATGWEFPDNKVAPGSMYLSSTQGGALCYKTPAGAVMVVDATEVALPSGAMAAIRFAGLSGDDTRLGRASATALQGNGSFSVGCFVKSDFPAATDPVRERLQPFLAKWDQDGGLGACEWMLFYANGENSSQGAMSFITTDGSNAWEVDSDTIPGATDWYFVVGVHDDSDGTNHIFVDAVEDHAADTGTSCRAGTADFRLGTAKSSGDWKLDGDLAMAFKFSGAMDGTQITWLYNAGLGRSKAEILAALGDELSGLTLDCLYAGEDTGNLGEDASANGLDLSSTGADAPTPADGPGAA